MPEKTPPDDRNDWHIDARETLYKGFYRIDRLQFRHSLFGGGQSAPLDRELLERGNVTAVLPYDPDTDQVALVEQFRIGAMHRPQGPWLLEVIAGMIDTDETPAQVAIREAYEEAGLVLRDIRLMTHYLASPGSSTEEVFIHYAETSLADAGGHFGLAHEGEDILLHVLPADEALQLLDTGRICNALSIIALQGFRLQRLAA